MFKIREACTQYMHLIVDDCKLSKWYFDFYCHLLHKISVVNSKFWNYTTNILYISGLSSRLLKVSFLLNFDLMCLSVFNNYPCRKIWSRAMLAGCQHCASWLSILDWWSIKAWMIIAGLYWLVILATKSLPMIGRESNL